MDSIVDTIFTLLAGSSFLMATLYIVVTFQNPHERELNRLFAFSIITLPFYALASAYLYTCGNIEGIIAATRIQMFCIAIAMSI